jgi:hypothetical protein
VGGGVGVVEVGADDGGAVGGAVEVVAGTVVVVVEVEAGRLASPPFPPGPLPDSCLGGANSLPAETGSAARPMRWLTS